MRKCRQTQRGEDNWPRARVEERGARLLASGILVAGCLAGSGVDSLHH